MENKFIFTVSELTRHIKDTLESVYPDVWVEGEISNVRIPSSGHCYFTLKDEKSQMRSVIFRFQNKLLKFVPEDGLKVICRGRIHVYEPRGEYQLLVEVMEPRGVGDLQLAFEQLKKRLQEEGLFDSTKKKSLAVLPQRIAVITSPTGAAVRDIIKVISRRFPNVGLMILPVKVQGDEAPDEIVAALETANEQTDADVVILARGGGSLEDLWAFNTEKVARTIFDATIPVISAVGHEIDFTIADFVADVRAPTPSAAAELVVKEKNELIRHMADTNARLKNVITQAVERNRAAIASLHSHLKYPVKMITDYQLRLDDIHMRLVQTIPRFIKYKRADILNAKKILLSHAPMHIITRTRTQLQYLAKNLATLIRSAADVKQTLLQTGTMRLNTLNPLYALQRGFSITRGVPSMRIVKDAATLQKDDILQVQFSKGMIDCKVTKVKK